MLNPPRMPVIIICQFRDVNYPFLIEKKFFVYFGRENLPPLYLLRRKEKKVKGRE